MCAPKQGVCALKVESTIQQLVNLKTRDRLAVFRSAMPADSDDSDSDDSDLEVPSELAIAELLAHLHTISLESAVEKIRRKILQFRRLYTL